MALERIIKDIMSGNLMEADQEKRLDMLVRQGLMSQSKLPILKRGLAKMQGGTALAPNERDAVNSLINSFMFIVLGDDTVFNRAKMHTQKHKYQTEELGPEDETTEVTEEDLDLTDEEIEALFGDMSELDENERAKQMWHARSLLRKSSPDRAKKMQAGWELLRKRKKDNEKAVKDMKGMAPHMKNPALGEEAELEEARGSDYTLYHKSYTDAVNHALAHHAKSGIHSSDDDRMHHIGLNSKKPGTGKTTSVNVPATHKKTGKKHMVHIQVYNKGGSHPYELNTYSSSAGRTQKEEVEIDEKVKDMDMGEVIKDFQDSDAPQFKGKSKEKRREMAIAAKLSSESYASDKEEERAKTQSKLARLSKKKSREEMDTDPGAKEAMKESYKEKFQAMLAKHGKSLGDMSDEEKKKFFAKVDAAHKAKNEEIENPQLDSFLVFEGKMKDLITKHMDDGHDYETAKKKAEAGLKKPVVKLRGFGQKKGLESIKNPIARASLMKKEEVELDEAQMDGVAKGSVEGDKHMCATKIFKEGYGEGQPLRGEHAEPDADGNIEWYDVLFDNAIQRVHVAEEGVKILAAESHMNHKKKVKEEVAESFEDNEKRREKARADMAAGKYNKDGSRKVSVKKEELEQIDELTAAQQAARDSKSYGATKGMAKTKKDKPDMKHDENEKGVEHLVPQLRKAVSIGKEVQFKDGKTHRIGAGHANKFLNKYLSSKPHEKEKMQNHAHQSHSHFLQHVK